MREIAAIFFCCCVEIFLCAWVAVEAQDTDYKSAPALLLRHGTGIINPHQRMGKITKKLLTFTS